LPSVGWRTGQSDAPPDSHCSMSGADLLPFLAQPTVGSSGWLVHRTVSGAPCRPLERATRRPRIWRPTIALAAVGSLDSPVNYSRTPPETLESSQFARAQPGAPDTVRCTTGQSDVPDCAESWLLQSSSFLFSLFSDSST
jgi:hypothetical protein